MDLIEAVNYGYAYSFKYSTRPGTPAAERADQVSEDVKSERLHTAAGADHPNSSARCRMPWWAAR